MVGDDFTRQLLDSLDEAEERLEKAHQVGNAESFNLAKRTILLLQKKIGGLVR